MICDRCYRPEDEGPHGLYLCPLEPRRNGPAIWADDIPGGVLLEHGVCYDDGTPRRFDSKSSIRAAAKAKGLTLWADQFDSSATREGREYLSYMKSSEFQRERAGRREARIDRQRARQQAGR